ncbi:MAG: GlmU family protein [Flavobacteriales bacterium]|nr:GlmU family protein [Flavobacteriales bacterium]
MRYLLFDDENRVDLLPLAYTRPVAEFRIGILTIAEKWFKRMPKEAVFGGYVTEEYLQDKYPSDIKEDQLWINASICPNDDLIKDVLSLETNESLFDAQENIVAFRSGDFQESVNCQKSYTDVAFTHVRNLWDIFSKNGVELEADFELITKGRVSQKANASNNILGEENLFIEEGAEVNCAIINAATGPVYIAKDAEVMEGSIIRGPFALCEASQTKLGARIYGPTTVGPHSKVGGELNNVVIFGYSNKGHDGFLGNSVLGAWCNIGADSNNSNLKNNYADVRLWNYATGRFAHTGLQFCGLIMGDHSKCGINTMFNTGTVVGVSANIFGTGFPRNFIPSFSWGGPQGQSTYQTTKVFEVAEKVMERRNLVFNDKERAILTKVFELSEDYRR